jgi:hypothetical protein
MNIKNLKVGMEIKNYKKLCELLGEKVKTGNAMYKQLEEFKRYFEWEKNKYAFIITKIYSKPKAFTEQEMIELLLLHLLAINENDDEYTVIATKRSMYEKLKMVNLNYKYCINNPEQVAIYKNIPKEIVVDTTDSIDKALRNKLTKALDHLSDKRIIHYTDVVMIHTYGSGYRVATDDEIKICLEIEGNILKEVECETYTEVEFKGRKRFYDKRVKEELTKKGIKIFYRAMKIIFAEKRVPELVDKYIKKYKLSKRNYTRYIKKVNGEIELQSMKNATNRFKKASDEIKDVALDIKNKEEKNRKIDEERRGKGFGNGASTKRREELKSQRIDEFDIEKLKDRLEKLEKRSSKEYLTYVDELVKLVIDITTDDCTHEIREYYNSKKV